MGGTIGQAQKTQSTQTDKQTDRQAGRQPDRQTDTSKIRSPQFAIGDHQFLTRLLHFGCLCGGDHRTGPEDPEHTDRQQTDKQTDRQTGRQPDRQTNRHLKN